ncbi:hypothetical protein NADFUDRAFT_46242 [Nadsonia fulvescens var. elongata DSM 6958]|uniref:Uncharacterized protein n=1 Tax=Nadsonia fulvescens var. elongata DSM 6958 TaxID=857566 RepID=A0A1E3PK17_9ASCO|nr:hypothetical protein NADFUDRAFT_46242 [Nadsonia fulvescens var. elongata DSM 6958]
MGIGDKLETMFKHPHSENEGRRDETSKYNDARNPSNAAYSDQQTGNAAGLNQSQQGSQGSQGTIGDSMSGRPGTTGHKHRSNQDQNQGMGMDQPSSYQTQPTQGRDRTDSSKLQHDSRNFDNSQGTPVSNYQSGKHNVNPSYDRENAQQQPGGISGSAGYDQGTYENQGQGMYRDPNQGPGDMYDSSGDYVMNPGSQSGRSDQTNVPRSERANMGDMAGRGEDSQKEYLSSSKHQQSSEQKEEFSSRT